MTSPSPTELQRWSHEVARDPGAPSFVHLAEAYRRQGHREAALRVCLRGLSRHPAHVDAHALLGRLYLERGERDRAADEWSIVLRLDPDNFEAHRGLGFYSLERGDLGSAERHLARGRALRPDDRTVAAAVELLRERQSQVAAGAPARAARHPPGRPKGEKPTPFAGSSVERSDSVPGSGNDRSSTAPSSVPVFTPGSGSLAIGASSTRTPSDPARVFDELRSEASFRGAFVLDARGLVLGGRMETGVGSAGAAAEGESTTLGEVLGARLGPVVEEASRTAHHVGLGDWNGLLLETSDALLNVSPVEDGYVVVVIAARGTPPAWVARMSERACEIARPLTS